MIQIRSGVFETNSSSTHSLCMCLLPEYKAWKNGEMIYDPDEEKLYSANEMRKRIKVEKYIGSLRDKADNLSDEELFEVLIDDYDFVSYEHFGMGSERLYQEYETPSGETVVAFGECGFDG